MTLGIECSLPVCAKGSNTMKTLTRSRPQQTINSYSQHSLSSVGSQWDALPKKTGRVTLIEDIKGRKMRLPVILKVYINSSGRYAVVSRDCVALVKDCGFMNLKKCQIGRDSDGFTLIPLQCEGRPLHFRVSEDDVEDWLSVMEGDNTTQPHTVSTPGQDHYTNGHNLSSSPPTSRCPGLPSLDETEEEE